ncbi:MAG: right-handed parallel beta-helix repeat-containing protein, partial [Candidatus Thermoplasmatota archaeon]
MQRISILILTILIFNCLISNIGISTSLGKNARTSDIVIETNIIWENMYKELNENLIVAENGSLTLINTTLKLNCASDGDYGIEVASGGELYVYNSTITGLPPHPLTGVRRRFWFEIRKGANFTIKNSVISYCGYYDKLLARDRGLNVEAENVGIENCSFTNNNVAVIVQNTKDCILANCSVHSNAHSLRLESSTNITIKNCEIKHSEGSGIWLKYSDNNLIKNTRVIEGNGIGLQFENSHYNTLLKCIIYSSSEARTHGVSLRDSNSNLIQNCKISEYCGAWGGIERYGIRALGSYYNTITQNNFINNTALDYGDNNWSMNYWSDYVGVDTDGNGLGDLPYNITDGINADKNPLIHPFGAIHNKDKELCYLTIQKAIDDAVPGNTIEIASGVYRENIIINKTLSMIGENRDTTIIEGNGTYDVIFILAKYVNISGFGIRNGSDSIYAELTSNNNQIANCMIYNNSNGIFFHHSSNNTITNCVIYNNSNAGIHLSGPPTNCTITYCDIVTNRDCGIRINYCNSTRSESNTNFIYHNNFINNTVQARDECSNNWDYGYPSGGNYWSDYAGIDNYSGPNQDQRGSDGIGDTPYNIPGGTNKDRYPLITPKFVWEITKEFNIMDRVVVLNEDLIIKSGGKLTLTNVTLKLNCAFDGEYQIEAQSGSELYIYNSTITSATNYRYMFYVKKGAKFIIKNTTITMCGWNEKNPGLVIEADDTLLENCALSNNFIGAFLKNNLNTGIIACTIYDNICTGIFARNSNNTMIAGCKIFGNYYCGIDLEEANNCIIENSAVHNNFYIGISITYSSNIQLVNCSVYKNSGYGGVSIQYSSIVLVRSCDVNTNGFDTLHTNFGIDFYHAQNILIAESVIYNNARRGVHFHSSETLEVVNCNVYNNNCGVLLEFSLNNIIKNSKFHNNYYGAYFSSSSHSDITGCSFYNNTYGVWVDNSNNTTISNCEFNSNSDSGLYVALPLEYKIV